MGLRNGQSQALLAKIEAAQLKGLSDQRDGVEQTKMALQEAQQNQLSKERLSAIGQVGDLFVPQEYKDQGRAAAGRVDNTRSITGLQGLLANQQKSVSQNEINLLKQQAKTKVGIGGKATAAQTALDKEFGKEYAKFVVGGGFEEAEKGVLQIRDALNTLDSEEDITGSAQQHLPDFVRRFYDRRSLDTQQMVEGVVQKNLKAILGSQFTEKEGDRLISRAYDPTSSQEDNTKRLSRLVEQMQGVIDSKKAASEHFEEFGSLRGYKASSRLKRASDFLKDEDSSSGGSTYEPTSDSAKALMKELGL